MVRDCARGSETLGFFCGLPAKGVPEVFSHLLIKLSSKKLHEDDRQKIWHTDLSLPALGVPLLFWRRFVHSLLITLAKIDPGSLIISLNTTVGCTAMKFSGHRLLNKDRAVSVIRNCQAWPRATVWDMTPIFWHFSYLTTDDWNNFYSFFKNRRLLPLNILLDSELQHGSICFGSWLNFFNCLWLNSNSLATGGFFWEQGLLRNEQTFYISRVQKRHFMGILQMFIKSQNFYDS